MFNNIDIPKVSVSKELSKTQILAVVLTEKDLEALPAFLGAIKDNQTMLEDLKKNKSVCYYGNSNDLFGHVVVFVSKFGNEKETLNSGADLTRNMLIKSKHQNFSVYFAESITADQIGVYLQGAFLTNFQWHQKTGENTAFKRYESLTIIHKDFTFEGHNKYFAECSKYSLFARTLGNRRPYDANPRTLLELCEQIPKNYSTVSMEAIIGKELEKKGLNLIYNVGRGCDKEPCMIVLNYKGNPSNPSDIYALVGKGVCFDSGGLNIKATGSMEEMYADKGGACVTLGAFLGVVDQKLPINLVLGIFWVENLLGSDCYHPSDILPSYKGLTVEIGNTDAEGRLCLADTMSYVQKNYKPHTLIELSTLTGACVIALAGVWTNCDKLNDDLQCAAKKSCENVWRMPLTDEDRENTKSKVADLSNAVTMKFGASGANRAAAFLEFFVEKDVKWAHVDIAGVGLAMSDKFVYTGGFSGWGVQLLMTFYKGKCTK